jgi:hypothetical protein
MQNLEKEKEKKKKKKRKEEEAILNKKNNIN